MRALVISDSHGAVGTLRWMLQEAWRQTGPVDAYLCLGDGAEDVRYLEPYLLAHDPRARVEMVRGNNDFDCPSLPYQKVLTLGGARILMTHGHHLRVKSTYLYLRDAAREADCTVALFGHTHQAVVEPGVPLLMNPGCAMDGRLAVLDVENGRPRVNLLAL